MVIILSGAFSESCPSLQPWNTVNEKTVYRLAKLKKLVYRKPMTEITLTDRIDRARQIVEGSGERFTPLRAHVLELIIEDGNAIKAYDLLDKLKPDVGSPKPPTVYRALEFLSRHGLIHRVEALNAFIACDHTHPHSDDDHHHLAEFFICETCLKVEERHAHDHANCRPDGFSITRSVVEHYGMCGNCAA